MYLHAFLQDECTTNRHLKFLAILPFLLSLLLLLVEQLIILKPELEQNVLTLSSAKGAEKKTLNT